MASKGLQQHKLCGLTVSQVEHVFEPQNPLIFLLLCALQILANALARREA
eukprot:m.14215 g.14215  ORF g.14215 m.14215 type:complete len:50 (-) comp6355_c0_seq1:4193-4342(-)